MYLVHVHAQSTSSKHAWIQLHFIPTHRKIYTSGASLFDNSTCIIVGSPIRGFERRDDDDLPTIAEEEALSNELTSEVHV